MRNVTVTTGELKRPAGASPGPSPTPAQVTATPSGLPEPSPVELAGNVARAAARWIGAGFPVVSQATYDARARACSGCELWDGKARMGLGKCRAPGCGCTSLKRWLQTEKCQHPRGSRWPA